VEKTIFWIFTLPFVAYAILPLPYPTQPTEEATASPTEFDPRGIAGYSELYSGSQLREMELPHYENPPGTALGYEEGKTFQIPPELRERVDFWEKVFSKHTSHEAIIHDQENLSVVYQIVDLSHIEKNRGSKRYKRRKRNLFLRNKKKKIKRMLLRLDALRNRPLDIPLELFPFFKKFNFSQEKDRFLEAATRVRTQIGQRDHIVKGWFFGGRYFNKMMEIFEREGLPKELTRLVLVESGFNIQARSKVGASGIWQFTKATGKRYLRIDRAIDERHDPLLATLAAARLLRKNYERLKSWPLAITAYNHGREGMARASRKLATKSLAQIIRHYESPTFGFASSNFYTEFLAILEMERDYRKYFGKLMVDSPIQYEEVMPESEMKFIEFAKACAVKESLLLELNPAFTRWVTSNRGPIPAKYTVKVPPGKSGQCDKTRITILEG